MKVLDLLLPQTPNSCLCITFNQCEEIMHSFFTFSVTLNSLVPKMYIAENCLLFK